MSVDSILIKNGYVLTMDARRRIIEDGSVLVEGQKITRVGKTDELAKEKAELVIDANNMIV
ncbi:MAG: amidohydrolase, partial [Promethearchaeota archaeon]